jgi:hypothetical protein
LLVRRIAKGCAILFLLVGLLAAQVHLAIEFDPCLWSKNAPADGAHGFCGHACPASFISGWVGATVAPQVLAVPLDSRLKREIPPLQSVTRPRDTDSSRGPPLA